jgi:hypothetical protein
MRFNELPVATWSFRVKPLDVIGDPLRSEMKKQFVPIGSIRAADTPSQFDIFLNNKFLNDNVLPVRTVRESDALTLSQELSLGSTVIAQIGNAGTDATLELQIAFFPGAILEFGKIDIGVDDYILERAFKVARVRQADASTWFYQQSVFEFDKKRFLCITAGPGIDQLIQNEFEPDDLGNTDSPEEQRESVLSTNAKLASESQFCVTGKEIRYVASLRSIPKGGEVFVASKLTSSKQEKYRAVRLAQGEFNFVDWTKAGQVQLRAKAELANLTRRGGSYLRKWKEFANVEGDQFLARLRRFGAVRVDEFRDVGRDEILVRIPDHCEEAHLMLSKSQVDEVLWVQAVPDYLSDQSVDWLEYCNLISNKGHQAGESRNPSGVSNSEDERFKFKRYDQKTRTLTLKGQVHPEAGFLVLCVAGDAAQISRRLRARDRIMNGESTNPEIGVLIEEEGTTHVLRPPQKIPSLTAYVRDKVFLSPPTAAQQKAIEVALNTPDIALIQGPPGTGKTTVIAAILERLNEVFAQKGVVGSGEVLLTGFQHDAVENMIDRMSINGIPVPKFGERSGLENDFGDAFDRSLEKWCREVSTALRTRNPVIAEIEVESQIRDMAAQYVKAPTNQLGLSLARKIAEVDVTVLGESIAWRASEMVGVLTKSLNFGVKESQHLRAIRAIRSKPESFADDGPERARDVLIFVGDELEELDLKILRRASSWKRGHTISTFLADLEDLKARLLTTYVPPPKFQVEKPLQRLLILAADAIEEIKLNGHGSTDRKAATLLNFVNDLEDNPRRMREALATYSFAFASTVQQSVNKEMQRRKSQKFQPDQLIDYQYVIVDEAARVSPNDLLIPLSQGKKIILVGDHRQLPHFLDKEVEQVYEEGQPDGDESGWLKRSMFEYLFSERIKAMEEQDGIVRRVTLDQQFRMHPKLGDFVSRNFYERFESAERFSSGLPQEKFHHSLPQTNGEPAVWLEVPRDQGRADDGEGRSLFRSAEVSAIVDLLREWFKSPQSSGLSFGVISFYKAQALKIQKELERQGLATDRLRVGTVDSFQGMEFDVVLLSAVRTPDRSRLREDVDEKVNARHLFGHLCSSNRLNVSMSRQRKLLVVVGDPELVEGELAANHIPGLVDFYRISQKITIEGRKNARP